MAPSMFVTPRNMLGVPSQAWITTPISLVEGSRSRISESKRFLCVELSPFEVPQIADAQAGIVIGFSLSTASTPFGKGAAKRHGHEGQTRFS